MFGPNVFSDNKYSETGIDILKQISRNTYSVTAAIDGPETNVQWQWRGHLFSDNWFLETWVLAYPGQTEAPLAPV
jgi:hypothetical protein